MWSPCSPCAEVILALHGVESETNKHSAGDDKCFEDKVHVKVCDHDTERQTLENSLGEQRVKKTQQ